MPYDPTLPQENTLADAAQMRAQFAGIKDLFDALAAGTVTAVIVDGVNTVAPGTQASVDAAVIGTALHLTFSIPQGAEGANGAPGLQGEPGPQGPPFANALVDGVNTLGPGSDATVSVSFDGSNVRFTFGIPRGVPGADGANGTQGAQGNNGMDGAPGPQGAQGEVSLAQLNTAIADALVTAATAAAANSSARSNSVATLDTPFANDPPTVADMEVLRGKINELIAALRR